MRTVVISVGGSLIAPDSINTTFLKQFKALIDSRTDTRFIIVVGGGKICRTYQSAASTITTVSGEDKDWIGVAATHINAQLVRSIIKDTYEKVIADPTKKVNTNKRVIIAAGWKPGWSTDYDAVHLAQTYQAETLINMTNVDSLYDKDPKNKDAKKIKHATWKELQEIVGTEWKPGLNAPFDPVATKRAAKLKFKLYIIGPDVSNLQKVLEDKTFTGTTIE